MSALRHIQQLHSQSMKQMDCFPPISHDSPGAKGGRKMCCESMRYSAEVDEGNICHKALSMYFLVRNEIGRCTKTAGKEGVHSRERINFLVQSPCYCLVGERQSQNLRKPMTYSDPQSFNDTLHKHRHFLVPIRSNLS